MPTFDFRCHDCSATFEQMIKSGGEPEVVCPFCGSGNVEKIFTSLMYNKGTWRMTGKMKSKMESLKIGNMVTDGKIKIDD